MSVLREALSTDEAPVMAALRHALEAAEAHYSQLFEIILILEPSHRPELHQMLSAPSTL
jgi:hypothetical protein